jgi:putative secretion ATPase (PEP-CTERM system associated)
MYEAFFGLTTKPFELVPNPSFIYLSRSHRKARNYLKYGLLEGAGFILLTGEVGSGKTTIIRDFIAGMSSNMVLAMLFNTKVTNKQVLAMINEDFGLPVAGRDKVALLRELNDFLLEQHAQNKQPVLIVDEAQNLSTSCLEEIRLLSNLEASDSKLLQIIMVGQTELKQTIAKHELRQLRQRISVHCHLESLSRDETEEYILHRLELAGNRHAVNWGTGTFDALYRCSEGIPRLINSFCDFILLAAYVDEDRNISLEMVEEVIGDALWEQQMKEGKSLIDEGQNVSRQGKTRRLADGEGTPAHWDEFDPLKSEVVQRLQSLEEMLRTLQMQQEEGLQRIASTLEDTCKQLQETLTGFAAQAGPFASSEAVADPPQHQPRKRFFSKRLVF